ncbi:transcriptional regulator [Neorhodopirellula lusitana]|uniref:transcriptional regulator n=1 Tax=Neorhodopirellula lusitana TaxID=445327 RepID=UPI00384ABEAC
MNPQSISLPVVAASDYRNAVPGEMWEMSPVCIAGPISYRSQPQDASPQAIAALAASTLQAPVDFPAVVDAIVPGDHVALAVDPYVPSVEAILAGVLDKLTQTDVGRVSVVLWPETPDELLAQLQERFQNFDPDTDEAPPSTGTPAIRVTRHEPRKRSELRYVAADADGEPMYLARDLVDADLTIPIMSARAADAIERADKTGVFPMFADGSTIRRYQRGELPEVPKEEHGDEEDEAEPEARSVEEIDAMDAFADEPEPKPDSIDASFAAINEVGFLLGVQLVMIVSSDAAGGVERILAGTPDSIRHELETLHAVVENETRPTAPLVIAALDGDASAQTWPNVARAAIASARHLEGAGTIVIWSRLNHAAPAVWTSELPQRRSDAVVLTAEDDFDDWQADRVLARKLATLLTDHRILLYSELDASEVESLGLGVISSVAELKKLGESHHSAGVIRAAQFHDSAVARLELSQDEWS